MFFQIEQDSEGVIVSLECLENLLACANELLSAWRQTRSDAQTHNVEHDRRMAASSPGVRVDGPVGPRE